MDLNELSVKEMTRIISPILKRNFLEWKQLKKKILSKSGIKSAELDEKRLEKVISSEPLALFYATWLKLPNSKESTDKLNEKITGYIRGLFSKELDQKAAERLSLKCRFITGIYRDITPRTIKAILAMAKLYSNEIDFQKIMENETAYKTIMKSSMSLADWRLHAAILLGSMVLFEITPESAVKFHCFSFEIVSKREKEIFS
jgi:hypothetical protein